MRRFVYKWLFVAVLACAAPAAAQDSSEETPSEARAAEFVAVEGAVAEDVPGGPLLIGAYGVAWAFLFLYIFRVGRLQGAANQTLAEIERRLNS